MLWKASEISGYGIEASDGAIGRRSQEIQNSACAANARSRKPRPMIVDERPRPASDRQKRQSAKHAATVRRIWSRVRSTENEGYMERMIVASAPAALLLARRDLQ